MCRIHTNTVDLLAQLKAGQSWALDRIVERALPPLVKFSRRRLPRWARGASDTQDFVQDVLVRTLPRLRSFEAEHTGALDAFLRRAVSNQVVDEIRRAKRRQSVGEVPESIADTAPSPLEQAIRREGQERYREALDQLSPADRALIVARIDEQKSYAELAELTGKPSVAAARMAVGRALAKLAKIMVSRTQAPTRH